MQPKFVFFFLVSLFATLTLFIIALAALSGDPTLSKLVGIAWAVDSQEKRIALVIGLTVVSPIAGFIAGTGLMPRRSA